MIAFLTFSPLLCALVTQSPPAQLEYVGITGSLGYNLGNLSPKVPSQHDRVVMKNLNQVISRNGKVQSITLDTGPELQTVDIAVFYYMTFSWNATGHDPREIYANIAVDEAAFGPDGSTAAVESKAAPAGGGLVPSAPVPKISRQGLELKYVREYTRVFKLDVLSSSTSSLRLATLPFEVGTLRASGGGKLRLRFTVLSVTGSDPNTATAPRP